MSHLFIFNKDETLLDILDAEYYYDDNYKRQLNGEWSFTFYVKFEHLKHLEKPNKIGFFDKEEQFQLFKIQDCEDVFGNEESFEIYCVHDSYSLGELIIEDRRVIGGTARDAIEKCLENSNYSIGNVADLGEKTLNFYFISRLQGLHNIVETYGGELDFRFELDKSKTRIVNRYVDLKYRLGEDKGLRFTFDLNLQGVTRNRSSEGHFTVLYGRGKSLEVGDGYSRRLTFDEVAWNKPTNPLNKPLGDKFLVDPDAVARFGRIEGIYENDSIEDAEELLKATHKALEDAKQPKISYSATIEDLSNLSGYEHLKFVLGDSIIIQDEKYQLNNEARIVSESYSIKNKKEPKQVTLGYIQKGISDSLGGGSITNPTITDPNEVEIDDSNFPNTLPATPILKSKGLFSSIMLEWTFESKTYYNYEIYASKIQHFNPDSSNLIFKGKASSLLHEVKPSETWYYRARAVNTHGEVTEMSEEVSATTLKISDATEYFEDVAIKEALIDTLSLDRGWFGQLKGEFLDVKNLVVTDGNNVRTMYVDSFGRIHMNVSELKINSKDVISKDQTETLIESKAGEISSEVSKIENSMIIDNLVANGDFSNELDSWIYADHGYPVSVGVSHKDAWVVSNKTALRIVAENHPDVDSGVYQEIPVKRNTDYTLCGYAATHRARSYIVVKDKDTASWLSADSVEIDSDYVGGNSLETWKRVKLTFNTGDRDVVIINLAMGLSRENGHAWFHDFIMSEGDQELCWKPSVRETRTRISQLDDKIETKASIEDMSTYIKQNPYAVMASINSKQGTNGINIDENGVSVFRNQIRSMLFNDGVMKIYNSTTGVYMGYFGTNGDDLRACLYGTNTFSVFSNDLALLFRARYERDANYGNATLDVCGGINFIHKPGQDVGVNQVLLGNDDRSDRYGFHNMSIRCWNSFGMQDNNGWTNMFADIRRGRWIMKGALYQNTQTPPLMFSMNFDGEDEVYNSGFTRDMAVASIMNLKTGVYIDNDGECCSAIYGGHDELITTEYEDEDGYTTTHLNTNALNASLVVTCQEQQKLIEALQKELNEIKKYLKVA